MLLLVVILRRVVSLDFYSAKEEIIEHPGELKSTTRLESYKYDMMLYSKKTAFCTYMVTFKTELRPEMPLQNHVNSLLALGCHEVTVIYFSSRKFS